jgi:molecular chaperone DnaK
VHVFRNAEGVEFTPSAVCFNKANSLVVGREAKDRYELDPDNAAIEFKRDMGSDTEFQFARSGRRMRPEDLSAEVLKSLCGDVQRSTGEIVTAAVITVPADFDLPQNKATKQAAQLAGIKHAMLMTEPVAAAQAYSFESQDDKMFWLVYDFGGGTFDTSIIQVRDGLIQVVGHGGDNQLGGKNIDWAIVEQIFIPKLLKTHSLTDLKRGNPNRRGAMAKLKIAAEQAKIRLSSPTATATEIQIDYLCNDDRGEPIDFECDLKRSELEPLAAPFIRRTINFCKDVISGQRLTPANIGKLILVGGPTMMPYLRQMLEDPKEGLGIRLEFSVDPMTVVARGAAIFAASQHLAPDDEAIVLPTVGQFAIKLDYPAVTPDLDPEVAGTVIASEGAANDFSGYTIEFHNRSIQPPWRSGKIGLGPNGTFLTNVSAEKGRENIFEIELRDPTGATQVLNPSSMSIVVKGAGVIADPTHSHSLGIALANNELLLFYEKDMPLPFSKRKDFRTVVALKKGESGQFLRVPLFEGEKIRANRNRGVGVLKIPAERIVRDVPAGSTIEITVQIDKSMQVRTKAFLPILDDEFEEVMQLVSVTPSAKDLMDEFLKAKERLKGLRENAEATADSEAQGGLRRIDGECMIPEIESLVGPAASQTDAARQCSNVLQRLQSSLDDVEDALEWPALVAQAEKTLASADKLVKTDKYATGEDRRLFELLERETREAIEHRLPDLLRRRVDALRSLFADVARRDPGIWVYWLTEAKGQRDQMQDAAQADMLFGRADRAINNNDVNGLRESVRGLWQLLPQEKRPDSISDVGL